jgi:chromosome segregation ATPase
MACYESEELSFQHVSIERQIRETHQYPMEKSIQQFFRDSPELCLNICLALEEKVKLTVAIFRKAMEIIREKDLRIADKEEMLQQVRKEMAERIQEKNAHLAEKEEHIRAKNAHLAEKNAHLAEKNELLQLTRKETEERIAEKNQLLQQARNDQEARLAEKNACITEKNQQLQQARNDQAARLEEKDRLIQEMRHRSETERKHLTSMLERANNETLNLSQSLSVRGMLEKIEHQYSDKRRKGGPDVSRRAVWIEILQNNDALRRTLTRHCSERNIESKIDAVAATITQIYRQVSDEIHHAGYHEIPIQKSKFHGIQLDLLRDLCAATHFAIREV